MQAAVLTANDTWLRSNAYYRQRIPNSAASSYHTCQIRSEKLNDHVSRNFYRCILTTFLHDWAVPSLFMLPRSLQRTHFASSLAIFLTILCLYYFFTLPNPPKILSSSSSSPPLDAIPPNIWQVFFNHSPFPGLGESVQSWVTQNQDHSYMLIGKEGAEKFVTDHYSQRPEIAHTFLELKYPIFRADLLRYMLLEAKGGVYSDIDTTAVKPIREWIPQQFTSKTRAVVGIEYDQLDDPGPSHGFTERISFCQWTLASSKGHPMMTRIVNEVVNNLRGMARENGTTIAALKAKDKEVGDVTGPAIWTRVVMESLSLASGNPVTYKNITGLKEPRLFGDILILPIDGFGSGQPHSGSSQKDDGSALVQHHFGMFWRHDGWKKWEYLDSWPSRIHPSISLRIQICFECTSIDAEWQASAKQGRTLTTSSQLCPQYQGFKLGHFSPHLCKPTSLYLYHWRLD